MQVIAHQGIDRFHRYLVRRSFAVKTRPEGGPWIGDAWLCLCVAFGVITSMFSIAEMFRNKRFISEYAY